MDNVIVAKGIVLDPDRVQMIRKFCASRIQIRDYLYSSGSGFFHQQTEKLTLISAVIWLYK